MTRVRGIALAALAVASAMVVFTPLQLLLENTALAQHGLAADEIAGTPWNGDLRGARWNGHRLGDVSLGLAPVALLTGVQRVDVATDTFSIRLLDGRLRGIERGRGSLALDNLEALPGGSMRLHLQDGTLLFSGDGCVRADGTLRVELQLPGPTRPPMILAGPFTCAQSLGSIALAAEPGADGQAVSVSGRMTIDAGGRYRIESLARSDDPAIVVALQASGFQLSPTGLSRVDEGTLLP